MSEQQTHSTDVTIGNPLGFHVRPVQRFAEWAQLFEADVEVELRGRTVPGDSVMYLMRLGGRQGDKLRITAQGEDARQAVAVLKFLAENDFFVEDELAEGERPQRHVERLARLASCFESEIRANVDGKRVDAKKLPELLDLGLSPASKLQFEMKGKDARQAAAVLDNLVQHRFYVEEAMVKGGREDN